MTDLQAPVWVADRWAYDYDGRPRPFVHPLRSPAGHTLTVDAPADHPWHHALWFTIKFVNGDNFWEEYDRFGLLHQRGRPSLVEQADGAAELSGMVDWVGPDGGDPVIEEQRTLRHVPLASDAYAIDWEVSLRPAVDVVFDRTPFEGWGGYGGLTLRGRPDWHDTRLLADDGTCHDRLLGVSGRWCDLSGPVADTGAEAGVLFCDHPDNPRHPVPWYASCRAATYGDDGWSNFVNAAFLWHDPLPCAAGDTLDLRLRVVVHDEIWDRDRCDQAWAVWTAGDEQADEGATS
ncbi:MAG: PmoA family protein [Acidimicrobiia bacterium]|nr:PmoA family protein [Acidimicrobiia bacterium]